MRDIISQQELNEAVESNLGWCLECHEFTTEEVEPDAENYLCDKCGGYFVKGALDAVSEGYIGVLPDDDDDDDGIDEEIDDE